MLDSIRNGRGNLLRAMNIDGFDKGRMVLSSGVICSHLFCACKYKLELIKNIFFSFK